MNLKVRVGMLCNIKQVGELKQILEREGFTKITVEPRNIDSFGDYDREKYYDTWVIVTTWKWKTNKLSHISNSFGGAQ